MMVLVAAASRHGSTSEIAARIGTELTKSGLDVEIKKLEDVKRLERYDAFVIGSAIYLGTWLGRARHFVEAHRAELASRPTWLFASGSVVGHPAVDDDPLAINATIVQVLVETAHAREHKLFTGKLDRSKLGPAERASVRAAWASDGDYRDWQAVDNWAASIAQELQEVRGEANSL
jgi:menaquinone-dependent protoporphyrinogen oxidase